MKINTPQKTEPFTFIKFDGYYAVNINVKNHMKELFEKHKTDGFICCGYDWCTLIITFIDQSETLHTLWNVFDYDPSDNELYILSQDEAALHKLVCELKSIYNDTSYIEFLMSKIDYR